MPDPPSTHWPLEAGKAFSLNRALVLISLILLHTRRWDPVFLSEKWQDGI